MQLGWPATSLENWVLRNRVGFDSSVFRQHGELAEWLRQRFAKPSSRDGRIGSNPILSATTTERKRNGSLRILEMDQR